MVVLNYIYCGETCVGMPALGHLQTYSAVPAHHSNFNQRHSARTRVTGIVEKPIIISNTNKHSCNREFIESVYESDVLMCIRSKMNDPEDVFKSTFFDLLILIFYCCNFLLWSWIMILLNYSGQLSVKSGPDQNIFITKTFTSLKREYLNF